jgi:hypothetical protein
MAVAAASCGPRPSVENEDAIVRVRLVLLALMACLAAAAPAAGEKRPFHSLTIGYDSRDGVFYGVARADSLAWAELRTGIAFDGEQSSVQVGLRRQILPDVTAMLAVSHPLLDTSPRVARDFSTQLHGDIFWRNLFGLSLDGRGEQRQLSLNIWKIEIPIAGHVDGVPWVLR